MVDGVHGQGGHHVMQHVVVVRGPDDVIVTILLPQGVEMIVLVATGSERIVTLQIVQVRSLRILKSISSL